MSMNGIFRFSFVLLLLALLTFCSVAFPAGGGKPEKHNPKIDSILEQILQAAATGQSVSAMETAGRAGVPAQGNSITVVLELAPQFRGPLAQAVVAAVSQAAPGLVVASSQSFVKVRLPLNPAVLTIVDLILQHTGVAFIRPPAIPQALAVSEGLSLTGAAAYHASGFRGRGVKIAVIDLGFAGLSAAQARGELPATVQKIDYTGTGLESGTSHGTAVAEIIYDMAPEAELYLMKIADEVDLEQAKDDCIRYGIRVINHSIGWLNTNFYNGQGKVAEIAADARAHGILWVNAAGNYAQKHWKGFLADSDRDGWGEFSGSDEDLDIQVRGGDSIQLYLTWNDWPASAQDYDLYLFDSSGRQVALSDRLQTGTERPIEQIIYRAPSSGTYKIRIKAYRVSSPKELALFSLNHDLEYPVPQASIVAPADSAAVIAVGAINYANWTTGPAEPYSSQGPTSDGRSKPDISGPDQVTTSTLGRFMGTSAAAPHVAGAAALLISESPSLNAGQIESQLRSQAIAMGSPLIYGAGRLNLTPQVIQRPDLVIAGVDYSPQNPPIGSQLTFTVRVQNQGSGPAQSFELELRDSLGRTSQSLSGLNAGATATASFTRQIARASETYTFTVDPTGQLAESNEANNTFQLQVAAASPPPPPPPPTNRPPVASFTYSPSSPLAGQPVNFDGTGSYDLDGRIVSYSWDFNSDGRADASGATATYAFPTAGSYNVTLTVTDNGGLSGSTTKTVQVQSGSVPPPPPSGSLPTATLVIDRGCGATYQPGERITVSFSVSESATVKLFDFTTSGQLVQLLQRSLAAGQSGSFSGQVVGPAGIETLVLFARTSSGKVTTAACSFVIGQPGASASLTIDRGSGGSYRPGERITFTYSVTEQASVVIYDFDTSGTIKRYSFGWVPAGMSRSFTAMVVGPAGVETAVLVAYTRSGKVLTAAVSFKVVP
ncbi:MAG: S8 family serine peptidase [Candidatus Bipolaricaulia bacterium]